jgi:predicted N-acetyltransferase YhbS
MTQITHLRLDYLENHRSAIPRLAELHHAEWRSITPTVSVADRIARFEARARSGSIPTGFVALDGEQVLGMACLVDWDIESHQHLTPWLATVLVIPEYRRHGVGSALSRRVAEEAIALGFSELFLFTFDRQAFYSRLGWNPLEVATLGERAGSVMVQRF